MGIEIYIFFHCYLLLVLVHRRTFRELICSLIMVTVLIEKVKAISGDDDDDH